MYRQGGVVKQPLDEMGLRATPAVIYRLYLMPFISVRCSRHTDTLPETDRPGRSQHSSPQVAGIILSRAHGALGQLGLA